MTTKNDGRVKCSVWFGQMSIASLSNRNVTCGEIFTIKGDIITGQLVDIDKLGSKAKPSPKEDIFARYRKFGWSFE
jgi:hypothetical protein